MIYFSCGNISIFEDNDEAISDSYFPNEIDDMLINAANNN